MIKVLIVSTNADEAGAPIHVETLVSELKSRVEFMVVFGEYGPIYHRIKAMGIMVRVVTSLRSQISPVQDCLSLFRLLMLVKEFSPDLVHAHSSKAGMISRLVGLLSSTPCIYTVHGWGWRGMALTKYYLVLSIESILSHIPNVKYIYVAKAVEHDALNKINLSEGMGEVIHSGVNDVGVVNQCWDGSLRILMVARVSNAKDHESLVKAFNLLDTRSELILCGEGTTEKWFSDLLMVWAPEGYSRIRCLGQISDISEAFRRCNVFALISNFEALPLSIMEAMSAGLPVVASNVGGVSELIEDGRNGLLVERKNIGQIHGAFERLYDRDFADLLGSNARQYYDKNLRPSVMADKTLGCYVGVIGESGRLV